MWGYLFIWIKRRVQAAPANHNETDSIIAQLERELETARSDLDNSLQDMEAANEELRSSNEELLSMNEELHSTNEKLEKSKQEISASIDAVSRANSDLQNLIRSSQIATVFPRRRFDDSKLHTRDHGDI